ncbi:MAG: O-acetylhomoserine aminocarboxypropyltransferase/cysteine synthase [Clostridiaceae bacterium]|nr:O-acetylhomoserine aminocarboxypropyltransferase/cysteine synthase [Clostridiaceae bacterium]
MDNYSLETNCLHAGYHPGNGEPRVLPITQSTTFKYDSTEQMGRLFALQEAGYFYTRLANPTCDAVAAKIAALEGGAGGVLTASGQAAIFFAIMNICESGDHFISASALYGGTFNLFSVTLKKMGVSVTFIPPDSDEDTIKAAVKPNTKLVYGETVANPALNILDIETFAKAAHDCGLPLFVDNTFPTPVLCRPFEWGADIVIHSTTKYMDGHATSVGGCIVDSGRFDWNAYPERFRGLTQADDSYHGVVYTRDFGKVAFITKVTAQLMRDLGSSPAPMNAFLLNLGLETLHLRVPRHAQNALAVAIFLKNHPKVSWVKCPALEGDTQYGLSCKYLPNGVPGVLSFGVVGGREAAVSFMDALHLASIATHVCDARTCVLHPASHTHRQLSEEALEIAGVRSDMIRLSVGIEGINDIICDLDQALSFV